MWGQLHRIRFSGLCGFIVAVELQEFLLCDWDWQLSNNSFLLERNHPINASLAFFYRNVVSFHVSVTSRQIQFWDTLIRSTSTGLRNITRKEIFQRHKRWLTTECFTIWVTNFSFLRSHLLSCLVSEFLFQKSRT